jgi:hypothetical protein
MVVGAAAVIVTGAVATPFIIAGAFTALAVFSAAPFAAALVVVGAAAFAAARVVSVAASAFAAPGALTAPVAASRPVATAFAAAAIAPFAFRRRGCNSDRCRVIRRHRQYWLGLRCDGGSGESRNADRNGCGDRRRFQNGYRLQTRYR